MGRIKRALALFEGICKGEDVRSEDKIRENDRIDLRVAILTHVLTPHRTPLIQEMAHRFAKVRVFVSSPWDEPHKFSLSKSDLDVVIQRSLNWAHRFCNRHGYSDVSYINVPYDTWHQLKVFAPDVILSTECGARSVLSTLYRIAHPKTKLIVWANLTEHTEVTRGRLRRVLRRWILRYTDAVFVNGRSGEAYIRTLGFQGGVFTVPYTIDTSLFDQGQYNPGANVRRLLFTGQLIERKGLRDFCSVLSRWCAYHAQVLVRFHVVGDGPERAALESMCVPSNLELKLFKAAKQDELGQHYADADIYAFPSLGDEWGVVVNEAMIAGLPVLGSVCSGAVDELLVEGETGWLFSPYSEQEMYAAIDRALRSDVGTLIAMSRKAKTRIAQITPARVAETAVRAIACTAKSREVSCRAANLREGGEFTS